MNNHLGKSQSLFVRTMAVLLFAICAMRASAQYEVIWSDSFFSAVNTNDVNYQYNNGTRQGGVLAPISYAQSPAGPNYHHQLNCGNGQYLHLIGDNAAYPLVSPNHNFNGLVSGRPVSRVSFQFQMGLTNNHQPIYQTAMFTLCGDTNLLDPTVVVSGKKFFGVRFIHDTRFGAGDVIQYYDSGTLMGDYKFPAGTYPLTNLISVAFAISDPNDLNPWNGVGATVISMYVNNSQVASYTKGGGGYANNHLTMKGAQGDSSVYGNISKAVFGNLAVLATSTNIYISSSGGNDSNYGNSASYPLATFNNLSNQVMLPGTTIYLKRGDVWSNSVLHIGGRGSPGNPIRLTAYGEGNPPVISGVNVTNAPCIQWDNPSYVSIDSLDLRNAKLGIYMRYASTGYGSMFNNSNVTVTSCHFRNMNARWTDANGNLQHPQPYPTYGQNEASWGSGIWVGGNVPTGTTSTLLDGLTVTHCGFQGVNVGMGDGFYWPTLPARNQLTNLRVEDCWIQGTEQGIIYLNSVSGGRVKRVETYSGGTNYIASGTTAGFLEDCIDVAVTDSEFSGSTRPGGPDGLGFDFEGNTGSCSFSNNVVHNNEGPGLLVLGTGGANTNLTIINNTWYNNARNASGTKGYELDGTPGHSGTFNNNGVYVGAATTNGPVYAYDDANFWSYYSGWPTTRTNTPYSFVSGRPLAWDFAGSDQGWAGQYQWSGFGAAGGALVGTSTGVDPYLYSPPTWVNTREYRWVHVRMSQTAGSMAQIYFKLETESFLNEAKSALFPIIADGQMRDYIVPVGPNQNCHGVVTVWRLDPTDAAGSTMVIDAFEAMRNPYLVSVTPVSASLLNVSFNQAMLPDAGVFNPANYALSGSGRGTLASQPDSVSLIAGSNGPIYQLKWNTGTMYAASATLNVSSAQNSRGIPVWTGSPVGLTNTFGPPITRPLITSLTPAGNNLVISGQDGMAGLSYLTLTSTNVAAPLSQWTPVATNVLAVNGNFSFTATNSFTPGVPQRFYMLQAK